MHVRRVLREVWDFAGRFDEVKGRITVILGAFTALFGGIAALISQVGIFKAFGGLAILIGSLGLVFGILVVENNAPAISEDPPTSMDSSAVVAPPMPTSRPGYTKQGPGVAETIRIYGRGEPTLLTDFPKTMNDCGKSLHLVRWRSLGGPIVAGMTAKIPGFDPPVRQEDLDPVQEGEAGLLEGTQCDEPAFILPAYRDPNSLVDVVVEYEVWPASP